MPPAIPYLAVTTPPAGLITVALVAPGVGDPSTIAALAVAASLTPDFRTQVASVSARTSFDVELTLVDGRKIIWGEATDSDKKMQILPALLVAQEGTEYDVTDPTLVTVRSTAVVRSSGCQSVSIARRTLDATSSTCPGVRKTTTVVPPPSPAFTAGENRSTTWVMA